VKLLLDANLSPALVGALQDRYPGTIHVESEPGLVSNDNAIWQYAKANDFVVVSKDADFVELSLLFGPPPKVILLQLGNCPTSAIQSALLRRKLSEDADFTNPEIGLLVIYPDGK